VKDAVTPRPDGADDRPVANQRIELPGPTGESNTLEFHPCGVVACIADSQRGLIAQARAALATGNAVLMLRSHLSLPVRDRLLPARVVLADALDPAAIDLVLLDAKQSKARSVRAKLAAFPGKIVPVVSPDAEGNYDWARLVTERTVTINTAAAGGNAALLSLADDAT
jgi:RHH-type proline utilization regulon transcriptional repressor/proline dehydrogenase/delta 1-pyrroline-5-carboxylate dehydrogenase